MHIRWGLIKDLIERIPDSSDTLSYMRLAVASNQNDLPSGI